MKSQTKKPKSQLTSAEIIKSFAGTGLPLEAEEAIKKFPIYTLWNRQYRSEDIDNGAIISSNSAIAINLAQKIIAIKVDKEEVVDGFRRYENTVTIVAWKYNSFGWSNIDNHGINF